jgi:hypothetical protein
MTTEEKILRNLLTEFNHRSRFIRRNNLGWFDLDVKEAETDDSFHYQIAVQWSHPNLRTNRTHIILMHRQALCKKPIQNSAIDHKAKWHEDIWNRFIIEFFIYTVLAEKSTGNLRNGLTGQPIVSIPIQELILQENESVKFINEHI